jgi:hypothetical protein
MKATFTINGNVVDVEGTPQELAEILFGIQEPSSRSRKTRNPKPVSQPESASQETSQPASAATTPSIPVSYAKTYHDALGTSMKEYIGKDASLSTDAYVIDIQSKITAKGLPQPPEDRLRKTIEAAKALATQPTVAPNDQ